MGWTVKSVVSGKAGRWKEPREEMKGAGSLLIWVIYRRPKGLPLG